MAWWNLNRIFKSNLDSGPIEAQETQESSSAGFRTPDAIGNLRGANGYGNNVHLRTSNDLLNVNETANRTTRYKEYARLLNRPEIESTITVLSQESCIVGSTNISTPFYGKKSVNWLLENVKEKDFFVYSYDFDKKDFTLGTAYDLRFVKKAKTVTVALDDGTIFRCTLDHRVLLQNEEWIEAGKLSKNDKLMAFYREEARPDLSKQRENQFPRLRSRNNGWTHERMFIDSWKLEKPTKNQDLFYRISRAVNEGYTLDNIEKSLKVSKFIIQSTLKKNGFSLNEMKILQNKKDYRTVIAVTENEKEENVYDLSVDKYENFCGDSIVFHNCQIGENDHVAEIITKNERVEKELDYLFFNRKRLNLDRTMWAKAKKLFTNGDYFDEIEINEDYPEDGVCGLGERPPESMFRIETVKGKLLEFQQSPDNPQPDLAIKYPIESALDEELNNSPVIRFDPSQIIHMRLGEGRTDYYPYGLSLIEPARGPAHQLSMMEDGMLVYRLSRAPERRVFYIDTGGLPSHKIDSTIERLKSRLMKRKVSRTQSQGASSVDERYSAPAVDEDIWLPIKPNSQTRIDTLPGASALGEVDDVLYFRNKLFQALMFPQNYFNSEDPSITRMTASTNDVKLAQMVERLQKPIEDALYQIADTHLRLKGIPESDYEDLKIKLTPPSDWREMMKQELWNNRIANATAMKSSLLMSDFDILTKLLKFSEEEAKEIEDRNTSQKLRDLRLNIIAQNPELSGVGTTVDNEPQIGMEAGGPMMPLNPNDPNPQNPQSPPGLPDPNNPNPEGDPNAQAATPETQGEDQNAPPEMGQDQQNDLENESGDIELQDPTQEEIDLYDMEIKSYSQDMEEEETDFSYYG